MVTDGSHIWQNEPRVQSIYSFVKVTLVNAESEGYVDETEGFLETDIFESHPWRLLTEQIKLSRIIASLISGEVAEEDLKKYGFSSETLTLFREIKKQIDKAYAEFLERVESNLAIPEADKTALVSPEKSPVKMLDLQKKLPFFIARYLVQMAKGDIEVLTRELPNLIGDLNKLLDDGFQAYIKVYEIDIPLYDKVYEELDELRRRGEGLFEIYLGRDGIYAWIARRTQDIATRWRLGPQNRKRLKALGELVEIKPKYLIYPRYFRDRIDPMVKKEFLSQESITQESNPIFFDTGLQELSLSKLCFLSDLVEKKSKNE